jgi:hypothetical protein
MDVFRPRAEDAAEATQGAIALVDGALWPCWSWSDTPGLKLSNRAILAGLLTGCSRAR